MQFSLYSIQKIYRRARHRDTLKRPYMLVQNWYILIVFLLLSAALFHGGVYVSVFQKHFSSERKSFDHGIYALDIDFVNETVRLYEEKETAYTRALSERVETKDPSW